MEYVTIDDEMRKLAKNESERRKAYIKHHFEVAHLSVEQRDAVGFLGEFACCKYLGIDWKLNIRDNYLTIDEFDVIYKGKRIDIKTETIPNSYALKILNKTILDDRTYGRRLINENQLPLLNKYDLVIFGMFIRDNYDKWYPIGFIESSTIIRDYPAQRARPDGGGSYPSSAAAIKTSQLKPLANLL